MTERTRVSVADFAYDRVPEPFDQAKNDGLHCLRAPSDAEGLVEFVRDHKIQHCILDSSPVADDLYEVLPTGAVLARFGVGYDELDLNLATAAGLLVANTPGVLTAAVAEHAAHLIMQTAKVPVQRGGQGALNWERPLGRDLQDQTLAILGCGRIGRRLARICGLGLGMTVIGCEPDDVDVQELKANGFHRICKDFEDAVRDADIVSLNMPATPATQHFINAERLARIPAGAWLVNTARGALIDETALYQALADGRLAGAALDVFETEPYQPQAPDADLRNLPNALFTCHVGSATLEAFERMATRALWNVQLAVAGDYQAMDMVNPDVLARL